MNNKILIMGKNDSPWMIFYLENVFQNKGGEYEVILFGEYDSKLYEYCADNKIVFYYPNPIPKIIQVIPKIRTLFYSINYYLKVIDVMKKERRLHVVHIHFVKVHKLRAIKLLRKITDRVVCTFWGSDLYRQNDRVFRKEKKFLKYIDDFTVSSKDMQSFFLDKFGYENDKQLKIIRFGINAIDELETLLGKTDECKCKLGIPSKKMVITVGYNGIELQQHTKVIREISRLPSVIQNKIFFLLPMTYGLTDDYLERIKDELKNTNCGYKIISEYIGKKELATLRMATDIFIHAQLTDAFSASVQEYLFAKKIVFNPTWISYSLLKEHNGFFFEYSSFEELYTMLYSLLSNDKIDAYLDQLEKNHRIIYNLSSWNVQVRYWRELYR